MPVVVGVSSISGITTAVNSTDAAYKEYTDARVTFSGVSVPTSLDANEFLFTNGSSISWQPIQAVQEYTASGSYSFSIPTQAKKFTIEATGAGGGGASGSAMASAYVPSSLWALRTAGTTLQMNALGFKDGLYLLGGTAAAPAFWRLRTSGTRVQFNASTYISDYLLGGATGILLSSTNAIQWRLRTSGTINSINALGVYGGNYIAGGTPLSSYGTQRTSGFGTSTIFTLMYDGTNYFAAGAGGTLTTSTDSVVWTYRTSGTVQQLGYATGGNGLLYASGATEPYVYAGNALALATSTDSISWTLRTSSYSFTLVQWTQRISGFGTSTIFTLMYDGTNYFAAGAGGTLTTSTDSVVWTYRTSGTVQQIGDDFGGNGLLYASGATEPYVYGGESGALATSTNSIVWTLRTSPNPLSSVQWTQRTSGFGT